MYELCIHTLTNMYGLCKHTLYVCIDHMFMLYICNQDDKYDRARRKIAERLHSSR